MTNLSFKGYAYMWRHDLEMLLVWDERRLQWFVWCETNRQWILLFIQYFANVAAIVRFFKYFCFFTLCNIISFCSKNAEEYDVGQENLYTDPCDEWLDLFNMKLTSPNYPDPYDRLTDCKWNLTIDKGKRITLDFEIIIVCARHNTTNNHYTKHVLQQLHYKL